MLFNLFNFVQADPELEAIRQRRMQELMAQRGGGGGVGGVTLKLADWLSDVLFALFLCVIF